jgi:hypothetical protein
LELVRSWGVVGFFLVVTIEIYFSAVMEWSVEKLNEKKCLGTYRGDCERSPSGVVLRGLYLPACVSLPRQMMEGICR